MKLPLVSTFALVAAASVAMLAGCTLGPTYDGPTAATAQVGQAGFARAGDLPVTHDAPPGAWWRAFGDPVLDDLEQRAIAANLDLDVAKARLSQSRAAFRLERANHEPTVSGTAAYAHARIPGLDLNQLTSSGTGDSSSGSGGSKTTSLDLYTLGFDASWEIDIFGGTRRAIEAARANADAAEANLQDVRVTLSADIASAYVALRDTQRRSALEQASIDAETRIVELTRDRVARGTASELDVVRLDDTLAGLRADLQQLDADREASLDQIAVLLGEAPGTEDDHLAVAMPLPLPPASVALGDPGELLRRRPDVRAAERTLAADTAKIGQAEAARYPTLKLFGILGLGGTHPSDLTHLDDFTAIAAPMLQWNFADFGRARTRVDQAGGVRDEAEAQYRRSMLAALKDAEDSLSRFRHGRETVAARARSKAAADRALALTTERYEAGTVALIDVLDATRRQASADQGLSQAEADLTRSFVAVQKALGLGWDS